jgi:hypothetical protein
VGHRHWWRGRLKAARGSFGHREASGWPSMRAYVVEGNGLRPAVNFEKKKRSKDKRRGRREGRKEEKLLPPPFGSLNESTKGVFFRLGMWSRCRSHMRECVN